MGLWRVSPGRLYGESIASSVFLLGLVDTEFFKLPITYGAKAEILVDYYHSRGAVSGCLQDSEREFLESVGEEPLHNSDMWFEFLRTLGYSGALSDMMFEFFTVDE